MLSGSGAPVSVGESVVVLLNAAHNGILRAWRNHGCERDPMGRVFRKADDLLMTALAGVYVMGLVRQAQCGNAVARVNGDQYCMEVAQQR